MDLINYIASLAAKVAELERAQTMMMPRGKVMERDKDKGVRVQIAGTDDEPVLSPWIKMASMNGQVRSGYTPKIGETVMILSPHGNMELGVGLPFDHTDANPNPANSVDETVFFQAGANRMAHDGEELTFGGRCRFTGETVFDGDVTTNAAITNKGKNIGDDHTHEDVTPGVASTGPVT